MTNQKRSWPRRIGLALFSLIPIGMAMLLVLLFGLLAVGLWATPSFSTPPTPHHQEKKNIQAVPVDNTPAATVLKQVSTAIQNIGSGYTYSPSLSYAVPADPALSGCSSRQIATIPAPAIYSNATLTSAAATVMIKVNAYSAGLGQRVLDQTSSLIGSCGAGYETGAAPAPMNGFTATANGSNEAVFRQGDVVITLISFGGSQGDVLNLSTQLSNALLGYMQPVCLDLNAPASAATLNPVEPDYSPPTKSATVAPPSGATPPDMSLLNQTPPTAPTPATGTVTTPPTPPTVPTVSATATVQIPVADPTGPGCGWTFSGEVKPQAPSPAYISGVEKVAQAKLAAQWAAWPNTVTTYLQALSTYNANLASYNAYQAQQATAPPAAPINLTAQPNDSSVTLMWTAPPTPASPIQGYTVIATNPSGATVGTCSTGGGATSCTVTGLTNGVTYSFTVTATNAFGSSPKSNSVRSTPEGSTTTTTTPTTTTTSPTTTTTTPTTTTSH